MENQILEFIKAAGFSYANKLHFSPVPKGNSGDLAMSFFELTKELKRPPFEIAKEISEILNDCNLIDKSEITGPYLNLFFKTENFFKDVFKTPTEINLLKGHNTVIEYSGPNTNKPLHLGHMRNHALGISVCKLLEKAGAKVTPVNIINDRGVHICKSMLAYKHFGNGETPEQTGEKSDLFVGRYYVKFETESKKNPKLNEEIQEMLVAWENNDPETRELWKKMNNWTLSGHKKTYDRQGVKFEKEYFESDYYQNGKDIAQMGLKKGVFQKREDGTVYIDLTEEGLDEKVVLRADGTSIYLTNDLAVDTARMKDFKPNEIMHIVADEQNYHFKVLFLCLDKLGIIDTKHLFHLGYGLVNLPDGRMKSREGNVVDADDLMNQLHEIAAQKIKEFHPELDEQKIYTIAEQIQNAAWKFYLLRTGPRKSITFDSQKSIDFHGATGPYLQYAGVRIKSILKKAGKVPAPDLNILGEEEKPLGVKILEFPKVLERAATEKNPTFIATYLTEFSQVWSTFYAENSILKAETEDLKNSRLALAAKVYDILESGLEILGIEIPEKM